MRAFHLAAGQPLTLRVYLGADPKRAGIVTVNETGLITTFEEKPEFPKSTMGAGGIYIADQRIFDYFPEQGKSLPSGVLDLSYHVLPHMVGAMQAYESDEFSMDIGTPESYEAALLQWKERRRTDCIPDGDTVD